MLHFLLNLIISVNMRWNDHKIRQPLMEAAGNTETAQLNLLIDILKQNKDTEFGRAAHFSTLSSLEEYRDTVPTHEYDQLAPLIERQMHGEQTLTAAPPVYYARTSGTTGRFKDIPLTHHGLQQISHAQKLLSLSLWRDTGFMKGSILGFASPMEEGRLANGLPYGAMSGSTYASISKILARKFVLPTSAFSIADVEAKYQVYCLAVLASKNLTGIATANPSSILKLVHLIADNADNLLAALEGKKTSWLLPEARSCLPEIQQRMDRQRVAQLKDAFRTQGSLAPHDIWPKLSTIATWMGGSCGIAINQLKRHLPAGVRIVEFGYAASEFMGSANVAALQNTCLPLLNHHVYEFVKRADWEAEEHEFLGLHELVLGEDYYVFITNRSGLYRYDINDIVRAEPGIGDCPAIKFVQKGKGVTSITGEKLSEHQLIEAVNRCEAEHNIHVGGFMALADEQNRFYHLYLEHDKPANSVALANAMDEHLRQLNSEYDDKRSSGRLGPLSLSRFRNDACDTIKEWSVSNGVRESQYKPTILGYAKDWSEKLSDLVEQD
ncbi:MAG: hypothetical protein GKR97_19395 [Rhizobiaceae bacterium]|nr:hypothetical protein [Rhizobiaceae bacterium]